MVNSSECWINCENGPGGGRTPTYPFMRRYLALPFSSNGILRIVMYECACPCEFLEWEARGMRGATSRRSSGRVLPSWLQSNARAQLIPWKRRTCERARIMLMHIGV